MDKDIELIKQFKSGDKRAFEQIVQGYKNIVFNTCFSITGNRAMCEDITQEVFIKIYNSITGFKKKSSLSTWIYRITVNTALNELRKKKNEFIPLETNINADEKLKLEDVLKSNEPGLTGMEKQEISEMAQKMLNSLPEKYRIIIVLKEIDGLSYNEIADTMKISVGKVKIWLFRARQMLKEKYNSIDM